VFQAPKSPGRGLPHADQGRFTTGNHGSVHRSVAGIIRYSREETMAVTPFHLAFPVDDLDAARAFYGGLLGCPEGRSDATWVDFNLHGHQVVAHLCPRLSHPPCSNTVDGRAVPIPHFGCILPMDQWQALAERLQSAGIEFVLKPTVRFRGQVGEQATLFIRDPSGNVLEFKAFADFGRIFSK
jgi:uncharacterized protein